MFQSVVATGSNENYPVGMVGSLCLLLLATLVFANVGPSRRLAAYDSNDAIGLHAAVASLFAHSPPPGATNA